MKAIVVGASGVTRELTRRLGPIWEVTVVDADPERLRQAREAGASAVLPGDGSSRVTLRRAGLARADAVVAATEDDEVNLEVCRLARQAGCLRVVAVAADPDRLADFRRLGVEAYSTALAAPDLEGLLDPEAVSSTTLAAGRSEAVEFRIGADSPVRGRALRDMGGSPWLVASILRGDRLIVPHGATVLEVGDVVTVVGAAADYPKIVHAFLAAEARFPREWGRGVAVALDGTSDVAVVAEALALAGACRAAAVIVHRSGEAARDEGHAAEIGGAIEQVEEMSEHLEVRWYPVPGPPARSLGSVVRDRSIGVVVLPAPRPHPLAEWRARRALRRAARLGRPVLFARGVASYDGVVVWVEGRSPRRAEQAAAELAAAGRLRLAVMSRLGARGQAEPSPATPPGRGDLVVLGWPGPGSGRPPVARAARVLGRGAASLLLVPEA